MKSGSSYTSHKCPHCGKFHNGGTSNPGGSGSADEGEEPGGSDEGTYDDDEDDPADESVVPDGNNDDDNMPPLSKEQEAKEIGQKDPVKRAQSAVRAKLAAIKKRDGK